jgi:catechol 2,3-dioxygenase-like lactoylglutathione lyase family enzyme
MSNVMAGLQKKVEYMSKGVDWSVRSLLITVSDLDRSERFYMDVCGLQEVLRSSDAALLAFEKAGIATLALRQVERQGFQSGQQSLGLRACSFSVGSSAEMDRVEGRLKALSAFQDRNQFGEHRRDVIRGHDPDRLPLQFLNFEPPMDATDYEVMMSQIFGVDL